MRREFRYLCLVGASTLLFFGLAPDSVSGFGPANSLAQGKSGQSPGHGGSNPGNSASSSGKNGNSPGISGSTPSALQSGPHQLAEDLGMTMGEFSSWIKSWRSAYRNVAAYEATEGNLNSLPGRQYAYGEAYFELQTAQSNYDAALTACNNDTSCATFDTNLAASLVEAQTALTNATTALGIAVTAADSAFSATLPSNQTSYDPALREDIDALIVQLSGAYAGLF